MYNKANIFGGFTLKKRRVLKVVKFLAISTAAIYAVNTYINITAVRKKKLSSDPEDFFVWKDIKVYYKKTGSGDPVILLHDLYPSSSAYEWSNIVNALSKSHRVYVLDLPGCGRSDKPQMIYTNFYYVQLLIEFIKSMVCEKVSVIATGLSSTIALMASVYDASKFSQIIYINPPSTENMAQIPSTRSKVAKTILEIPILGSLVYNVHFSHERIDTVFTEEYLYNPFLSDANFIDTYYESAHLGNGRGRYLMACIDGKYLNMNIDHALSTTTVPSSILIGSSNSDEEGMAHTWLKINQSINLYEIPHTSRLPQIEKPEETVSKIEKILRSGKAK